MNTDQVNDSKDNTQHVRTCQHQDMETNDETNTAELNEKNASDPLQSKQEAPARLDPTRYGDWEKNGRCIDF